MCHCRMKSVLCSINRITAKLKNKEKNERVEEIFKKVKN